MLGRIRETVGGYQALIGAAALAGLVLGWSPVGAQFDLWTYDLLLRAFPPPARPSASLILAIDEQSLNAFGGPARLREPLARAIAALARHEPAAIAVDVVLSEPRSQAENEPLAAALDRAGRVALAANLRLPAGGGASWEDPQPVFAKRAAAIGHVHAEPDADGVCRRVLLAKAGGRTRRWALALEAFRLARGGGPIEESPDGLRTGGALIPAPYAAERELRIRFPNPRKPIERLSLLAVLEDPALAASARGRTVFVGVEVLGGLDRYLMTPYSDGTPAAGVAINAAVYETLAAGDFLLSLSPAAGLLAALATAVLMGLAFRIRRPALLWTAAGAVLIAAHLAPAATFAAGLVAPAAQLVFVSWGTGLAGLAWRLTRSRRELDRSEAQRDRYQKAIHYVAHEMRSPLTAIQGSGELLSRYELTEDKRKQIGELVHRESQRIGKMIEMFLSVERLTSGQLGLKRDEVPVDELLEACVERARPAAERKRIRIERIDAPGIAVLGDREFLEYACYNLISNAVKYSPAQTAVTVRASSGASFIRIAVEDQGYGMDEADLARIFQKFYRARTAGRSGENGSGLGLAIVEEIVTQHGGSVSVESEVGRGSRFTLALPRPEKAQRTA